MQGLSDVVAGVWGAGFDRAAGYFSEASMPGVKVTPGGRVTPCGRVRPEEDGGIIELAGVLLPPDARLRAIISASWLSRWRPFEPGAGRTWEGVASAVGRVAEADAILGALWGIAFEDWPDGGAIMGCCCCGCGCVCCIALPGGRA